MATFYIDKLANTGTSVSIAGKEYVIKQLSMRDQAVLQGVIRKIQPNPYLEAVEAVKSLPKEVADKVIESARVDRKRWPSSVTSSEGMEILVSEYEGQKALLKCGLKINDEEADAILAELNFETFMRVASIAISGEDPVSEADHPKAETGTMEEKTT